MGWPSSLCPHLSTDGGAGLREAHRRYIGLLADGSPGPPGQGRAQTAKSSLCPPFVKSFTLLLRRRDGTTPPGHICHVRLGSKQSFPLSGPQCFPRDVRDTENLKVIRRLSETPTWSQKANLEAEARPQGGESRRCKTKSLGCV